MTRRVLLGALVSIGIAGWSSRGAAHPQHDSIARAHLRPGRLEVALRVVPDDLEEALRVANQRRVDLDHTPNVDALIAEYLRERFSVRRSGASPCTLRWVGKEVEVAHAWLYFEIVIPDGPTDHVLSNTLFFEIAPTQVNTVRLNAHGKTRTLVFTRQRARYPLA